MTSRDERSMPDPPGAPPDVAAEPQPPNRVSDALFPRVSTRDFAALRRHPGALIAPIGRSHISLIVDARLEAIGVTGRRTSGHALRATGAVLAYRAGADVMEIQAAMRHSSPSTTAIYLQSLLGEVKRAAIGRVELDLRPWDDDPPSEADA